MNPSSLVQYGMFLLIVAALVKPVGVYLARVFNGRATWLDPLLHPVERAMYRLAGIDPRDEMDWKHYAGAFLLFSLGGTLLLYAILRLQPLLHPVDPAFQPAPLPPALAMNTAISFATTTTWQAYAGETTMSYFSQAAGLTAQNFLAGAAGLAGGMAFIRGLTGAGSRTLGNFWVDVTRATLWVLLPAAVLGPWPWSRRACPRTGTRTPSSRRSPGRCRSWPRDLWPRWSPSRTSAPTAEGSSTPTVHTPTPIPHH